MKSRLSAVPDDPGSFLRRENKSFQDRITVLTAEQIDTDQGIFIIVRKPKRRRDILAVPGNNTAARHTGGGKLLHVHQAGFIFHCRDQPDIRIMLLHILIEAVKPTGNGAISHDQSSADEILQGVFPLNSDVTV